VEPQNLSLTQVFARVVSRLLRRRESASGVAQRSGPPARASGDPHGFWMVGGQSEQGISREYRGGGSVWRDLVVVAAVVALGIAVTRPGFLDRLVHGSPTATVKADVLVVSAKDVDVFSTRQVASPRGYGVVLARNADDGIARVQSTRGQIAVLVVDGDMPGAKRVISAAKSGHPNARLVVLTGARQASDVSSRLLDAGIR
jgi:CheY-like chemotaxis protein